MTLKPLDVTTNRSTIPAVHDECLKYRRPPGRPKKREERPDAAVGGADGAGGDDLPAMYRRVRAKPQAWGGRFDDAGADALNATRFAGLEGEIANGYANSLLQVRSLHGC